MRGTNLFKRLKCKYSALPRQVKAALWFFICSFLQKGISTITTPIFTRLLTTAEFGQFNVFNSWLGIITIFVTLRLYHGSYTQGLVKYENQRQRYAASMQGLTIALCLGWGIVYFIGRSFWNKLFSLTTIQMVAMFAMIWATAVFNYWAAEQRVLLNYKSLVLLTIVVSAAKPIIGIILVRAATDKVTARILGLALVEIIGYSWLSIIQMRRGKCFFDRYFWKKAILLNLPLILHYLSQTVLNSADRIMISDLVNADKAGIYSLAYQISQVMTLFSIALTQTLTPWIYQKIKSNRVADIAHISYATMGIVAAVNLLLILIAPEVVRIFAPPSYYEAIWVVPPVALSVFFLFCYDVFSKFEFYYEKTHYVMFASVIGALINVITNYIFIKEYGYIAAAYTTLFCYVFYAIAHYIAMNVIVKKKIGKVEVFDTKGVSLFAVAYVVFGLLFMTTYLNNGVRYITILALSIICIMFRNKIIKTIRGIIDIRKNLNTIKEDKIQ